MFQRLFVLLILIFPAAAFAHVKWFSDYSFLQAPLQLNQLLTPAFWGLFALSLVSLPLLVYTDKLSERSLAYQKINSFLDQYSDDAPLIMRVAMGAVLLMSWQGDSYIAPEVVVPSIVWGWFQFGLALLLLFRETTFLAGMGIVFLYIMGIFHQGFFHMLDYIVYPAVGIYLIVCYSKIEKLRHIDLPVLYSGLGFSLCWVAFEKMIYPYWGLDVLAKTPALTMGLPHDFFLLSCAFIEFTLGYLLIICLLHRPLAIVVTLTFFTTTCFFGKTEIVGHTILHGALLVFIVKGPGRYYQAPIRYHSSTLMRSLFAMVNFVILFVVLIYPYENLAQKAYAKSLKEQTIPEHPRFEIPAGQAAPMVTIHMTKDPVSGWNVHLMTTNFKFAPEHSGQGDVMGEGHAHLYINGKKVGRIYSNWFHVNLEKGESTLKVTLNTNGHKDYASEGKIIMDEVKADESREVSLQHAH